MNDITYDKFVLWGVAMSLVIWKAPYHKWGYVLGFLICGRCIVGSPAESDKYKEGTEWF
jgi:hypothetical protein